MREIAIKEPKINELIRRRRPGLLSKCPPRRNVNKRRPSVRQWGGVAKIYLRDELTQKPKKMGNGKNVLSDPFTRHKGHAQSNKGSVGVINLRSLRNSRPSARQGRRCCLLSGRRGTARGCPAWLGSCVTGFSSPVFAARGFAASAVFLLLCIFCS